MTRGTGTADTRQATDLGGHGSPSARAVEFFHAHGVRRSELVGLSVCSRRGLALAVPISPGVAHHAQSPRRYSTLCLEGADAIQALSELERVFRPRWVWWSNETPGQLLGSGLRLATCWDLAAVHRVSHGGWTADPARIWAAAYELSEDSLPGTGQLDLLGHSPDDGGDSDQPVQPDGHLRPEWVGGAWTRTPTRWARWAEAAISCAERQLQLLLRLAVGGESDRWLATCWSESTTEMLCGELAHDGLPVDLAVAQRLIESFVGPRPADASDDRAIRRRRDARVLDTVPGVQIDLRSPGQVRSLLARAGIDVPDTRSWRLEAFRGAHPVVEALISWRKDERFATTFGYDWLDRQAGAAADTEAAAAADHRLRGQWTGCDGGAGRMTASAGLHSLPADLRPAVRASAGRVLVRADLGQIEPRVLAAVSGDPALAAATADDDLYAPVAARLGVSRPVAKVAVLAAMYGQTSGAAGEALKGLERAYPVAMRYLKDAYEAGRSGRDLRTHGGRLLRMWPIPEPAGADQARTARAARGRYARNAVIQGAAAELFKAWAVTVRGRAMGQVSSSSPDVRIVLCLHDELLLEAPSAQGEETAKLVADCLQQAAAAWLRTTVGAPAVRFVADISVLNDWSEAKS